MKKIKIFAKKPESGGIPDIEKKMITKDNAANGFTFAKPVKPEIKKVEIYFRPALPALL